LLNFGFGKNFSIFFHCSFVNFHRSLAIFKTPFDDQVLHKSFNGASLKSMNT
jgi:hypothetical protein